MFRAFIILLLLNFSCEQWLIAQKHRPNTVWGNWRFWGDTGDNGYNNPVLPADYSDIDCIRVGIDYYAISSTFQYSPGVVILHSKDLVNWEILSHAINDITQISPQMNWNKMNRYGTGIWAGAIRYHDKKYWIYFGTPDEGYFMTTAKKPEGPWEPLHKVFAEKGWDDCCPFWDDNGQGYLVGTNFNDGYRIHLFKMNSNGKSLIRESDKVIYQSRGSEANKLYKINGLYYHLFSEVKPEGRAIMMERSTHIYGPYTELKQLNHAEQQFNEPNQGGLVQSQKGDWYFLTHHGKGDWSGRVVSLLPVTWVDKWPLIGQVGTDKVGSMVWCGKKPVNSQNVYAYQTSDEFNMVKLRPQWEWNYQPRAEKWSLSERPGWLRLYAFKPIEENNLLKAGNTITQRALRTSSNNVTVKIDISGMTNGQRAGISHFGAPKYSALGVVRNANVNRLEIIDNGKEITGPIITGKELWLGSTWGLNGKSKYYYSADGKNYSPFGNEHQLLWESYRGDRLAIYSFNNRVDEGFIDVDFFHYIYSK
jgi:beta-xylosidase